MGPDWITFAIAVLAGIAVMYGLRLATDLDDNDLLADTADVDVYDGDDWPGAA